MSRKSISFKLVGGDPQTGVGGQLVLSEDVLMYDAFRELYEHDASPDKRHAFTDLKWVKFMGEEEGAFSHYDDQEKKREVTMECYGMVNPKLSEERRDLRDHALLMFKSFEQTEEGELIAMLAARMQVIRKMVDATNKDPGEIKDIKKLNQYMEDSNELTQSLLKLTKSINDVHEGISKRGGRKKTQKNVGGAGTSLNELGHFSRENLMRRRQMREEEKTGTVTPAPQPQPA